MCSVTWPLNGSEAGGDLAFLVAFDKERLHVKKKKVSERFISQHFHMVALRL